MKDLSLQIKRGEFTAIVGSSGSGKSTLLKLLLGIYSPDKGQVTIGDTSLQSFSGKSWRSKCAALLQDSYIFSDSIAENIAMSDAYIDEKKLLNAAKVANIFQNPLSEKLVLTFTRNFYQPTEQMSRFVC